MGMMLNGSNVYALFKGDPLPSAYSRGGVVPWRSPAPPAGVTPSTVLRKAADIIVRKGWGQDRDVADRTVVSGAPLCAQQAIIEAAIELTRTPLMVCGCCVESAAWTNVRRDAEVVLERHLGIGAFDYRPPQFVSIPGWNDHKGRTKSTVLKALRAAADAYEAVAARVADESAEPVPDTVPAQWTFTGTLVDA